MSGFPQRNLLIGSGVWTGDPQRDAVESQNSFDSLSLLLGQLKNQVAIIGDYEESVVAEGSIGSWANDTGKTITSITLTSDATESVWDVAAFGSFAGGAITGTASAFSISTVADTIQATNKAQVPTVPSATSEVYLACMPRSVTVPRNTSTTIYLVGLIKFSGGTPTAGGTLRARRVS
jgi:hypothetical protein